MESTYKERLAELELDNYHSVLPVIVGANKQQYQAIIESCKHFFDKVYEELTVFLEEGKGNDELSEFLFEFLKRNPIANIFSDIDMEVAQVFMWQGIILSVLEKKAAERVQSRKILNSLQELLSVIPKHPGVANDPGQN